MIAGPAKPDEIVTLALPAASVKAIPLAGTVVPRVVEKFTWVPGVIGVPGPVIQLIVTAWEFPIGMSRLLAPAGNAGAVNANVALVTDNWVVTGACQ